MRIIFFHFSLIFTLIISASCQREDNKQTEKPNIVLLFVDDWGWNDVGYRNPLFDTPNINQLKSDGMDFSRAYIATPTCSPSRGSLLTGKEPVRFQMVRHIPDGGEKVMRGADLEYHMHIKDPAQLPSRNWLPLEEITYAERLKELGYFNQFIGKWHLGKEEFYPTQQGFDALYGTTDFGHPKNYYPPYFKEPNPLSNVEEDEYLTDELTNATVDFIKNYDESKPFMLTYWYYSVHGPFIGRKDKVQYYKEKGLEGKYAQYAAMVSCVDESVGKIRQALTEKGIAENTIIMLISDQGGPFDNAPLRGGKMGGYTLCEGGARVPFIVYYPGITQAGSESSTPVQSLDIYPTLIEIASGKTCEDQWIQGKSLLPLLKNEAFEERQLYFFRSYEDQYCAVMEGDWKLIKYHSGLYELYHLKEDIGESNNLYESESEKAKYLTESLNRWEKEVMNQANVRTIQGL
ncbi:sulfatase [Persicobacter diffluens]|uniref:Sulfatase n=1 Tax=Persicobacter diffluens TaxID=981 RepID=A0AAN4W496_9BACT|nr:sulfatase [Persicobacter diffluens]